MTLSDANARVLDRCLDRAVYRIYGVCDKANVSLRTVLGLYSVSILVNMRHARLLDGLFDTSSASLLHINCINCLGYCSSSVCLMFHVLFFLFAA